MQAAARGEHAPNLAQRLAGILGHFETVDDENAIECRIGQRQGVVGDEGRRVRSFRRPVHHALDRRHEGDRPLGICEIGEIGRGVADAEHALTVDRGPALLQPLGDQPSRNDAEPLGVEGAQIDDIEIHRGILSRRVAERSRRC